MGVALSKAAVDYFAFVPQEPSYKSVADLPSGFEVEDEDGRKVAVTVGEDGKVTKTVIYFHGNATDLGRLQCDVSVRAFLLGVRLIAFDYPGYGAELGEQPEKPTIDGCLRNADAVINWAKDRFGIQNDDIVLWGKSLGGSLAARCAYMMGRGKPVYDECSIDERAEFDAVAGLILQSTFSSTMGIVSKWAAWALERYDQLQTAKTVPLTGSPVMVMHGSSDELFGPWHFEALTQHENVVASHMYDGRKHHDALDTQHVKEFLERFD